MIFGRITVRENIKAFIFDMDGVLIDSEVWHLKAKLATLKFFGWDMTAEDIDYEAYIGRSTNAFFTDFIAAHPESTVDWETMARKKHDLYREMLAHDPAFSPVAGVKELLERLQEHGYIIGLGTSSVREMVDLVLNRFDLMQYFQEITTSDEVAHAKPEPDIYLLAAKKLGVKPAECCVVEDATSGIKAAKAAGMHCIAFYNPHSGRQDLSLADEVVDDYSKLRL